MVDGKDITMVAMGGNSLLEPALPPTVENQFTATRRAVAPIAALIRRGERLVLTHGNGPQIGFMQLRLELARSEIHDVPLDSLVADSQGALGYMIERCLREVLRGRGGTAEVVSVVTEVIVDADDPAFGEPTKPVGMFYSAERAASYMRDRGWKMVEDSKRGYRRVVASPRPLEILQLATIRRLLDAGVTVIACGGGGIPVARRPDGRIEGLEAVIDKDRVSALLAAQLGVRRLFITTGVDAVYRDYLTDHPSKIDETTASELERLLDEGQFPAGSMGPKAEAAVEFLRHGGAEVVICKPEALADAFDGRAGTRIRRG